MTGEVSIRGRVLPIGGLKEKTMAALRHGVSTVIIPKANERDLEQIDQTVRGKLTFVTAETVETVLNTALVMQDNASPAILNELPAELHRKPRNRIIRQ